jgi:hypothetical protein
MLVVNLTPHPITLAQGDRTVTVPPCGTVARVATTEVEVGHVDVDGLDIPVLNLQFGQVEDLPAPREGVLYLVSALVGQACPDRTDVVSPGRLIRDDQGRVVAAAALVRGGA